VLQPILRWIFSHCQTMPWFDHMERVGSAKHLKVTKLTTKQALMVDGPDQMHSFSALFGAAACAKLVQISVMLDQFPRIDWLESANYSSCQRCRFSHHGTFQQAVLNFCKPHLVISSPKQDMLGCHHSTSPGHPLLGESRTLFGAPSCERKQFRYTKLRRILHRKI
jgi:hypothetical protein